MELVTQIIDILSDEKPNLENALIKTKVLLSRLGEKASVEWMNKELNGYGDDDEIPEYRIIQSQVIVNATDGYNQWKNMPAVTGHLEDKDREYFTTSRLRQSISGLEHLAHSEGDSLTSRVPPELWPRLSKGLAKGIEVEYAHCQISKTQILQVISIIRSRLLDFVLELEEKVPDNVTPEQMKDISEQIDTRKILNNAMFGDNTTIVVGNNNIQTVNNYVTKNDVASLVELFQENGVMEEDTDELLTAIENDGDSFNVEKKIPGPEVNNWMKKMLGKAVDTAWKVKIGAAGELLASAIGKFYGF